MYSLTSMNYVAMPSDKEEMLSFFKFPLSSSLRTMYMQCVSSIHLVDWLSGTKV